MKKNFIRQFIFYLMCGLIILTGIAWIINISSSLFQLGGIDLGVEKIKRFFIFYKMPNLLQYLLEVDLSTVTTFLLLLTTIYIGIGIRRMDKLINGNLKLNSKDKEHFPFWSTYKTTYVQLGLLGTLFAFIIAFSKAKTFAVESSVSASTVLLNALGTALWSTFSAVLLAFVVCPLIEHPFIKAINNAPPDEDNDEDLNQDINNLSKSFNFLNKQTSLTNEAFHDLILIIQNLGGVNELEKFMRDVRNKLPIIENQLNNLLTSINLINKKQDRLEKNFESFSEIYEPFKKTLDIKIPLIEKTLSQFKTRLSNLERIKPKYEKLKKLFREFKDTVEF